MSYILDALRRADAERERGRVPGLHAQALPLRTGDTEGVPTKPRQRRVARALLIASLFVLLALLAAAAWRSLGGAGDAGTAPPPTRPLPPSAPVAAPDAPTASPGAPATTTPPPASPSAQPDAPAIAASPILAPAPPAPPPARPAAPARPPAPAEDDALARVADLPPPARAALPPLQVSGTTYAENPALRMLILDGKVLQEGQDIAPGLRLESIGPRSAVLNHQGRRLRLTY